MTHPLREGMDAPASGAVTLHPAGWDPMVQTLELLNSNMELLTRIAAALTNIAAERDTIRFVPAGLADGTVKAQSGPRFRCKWLYVSPIGTGEPVLTIGSENFYVGSIQAVPVPIIIPFPRVIDVGVDVFLWDNTAPTDLPDFVAYIMGTTE